LINPHHEFSRPRLKSLDKRHAASVEAQILSKLVRSKSSKSLGALGSLRNSNGKDDGGDDEIDLEAFCSNNLSKTSRSLASSRSLFLRDLDGEIWVRSSDLRSLKSLSSSRAAGMDDGDSAWESSGGAGFNASARSSGSCFEGVPGGNRSDDEGSDSDEQDSAADDDGRGSSRGIIVESMEQRESSSEVTSTVAIVSTNATAPDGDDDDAVRAGNHADGETSSAKCTCPSSSAESHVGNDSGGVSV
jgi:hypothetical protein